MEPPRLPHHDAARCFRVNNKTTLTATIPGGTMPGARGGASMQKRPYDFEDIKRRREKGEKWASIAADYGRSKQAVEVAARRASAPGEVSVMKLATKLVRRVYKEVRREVQS